MGKDANSPNDSTPDLLDDEEDRKAREGKVRQAPTWMDEYVSGE